MKAILKSIKDKWNAEASLNAYKLFFESAPQKALMPYVVYLQVTNSPEYTMNTLMEDTRIQFSAFSSKNSSKEVQDIFEKIIAVFDDVVLVIPGYDPVLFERVVDVPTKTPEEAWQYNVEYRLLNQKK